ncbi:DNA-3-methyladenine glycosylase [uncultured Ilyobacter sp.]|uniref:DNA-3-methyladenine glycosylase n=1 Tax=uncultured Ilyobacter sp. TaxID=544433 RepID=UPI0029C80173|nr:DNA-3-methyladenine glycosylase [uncultured Ilyobacter sp.]
MKIKKEFYQRDGLIVAKELLGKVLYRKEGEIIYKGRIVEVEAYLGPHDKASHGYNNRKTNRTEVMFREGGFSYVYLIYGMYNCLNVVTGKQGIPEAVLIRALDPLEGIEEIINLL